MVFVNDVISIEFEEIAGEGIDGVVGNDGDNGLFSDSVLLVDDEIEDTCCKLNAEFIDCAIGESG